MANSNNNKNSHSRYETLFYKKLKGKNVSCELCPNYCVIKDNCYGKCKARKNIDGKLFSMVYAKPVSVGVDPIEKKPLYHFLPNSLSYSIGTAGCNLNCFFCQNWRISQSFPEDIQSINLLPKDVVNNALKGNCKSISYTYNEPTVFYEYVLDTAKLAKKKKLKNILVTNGFINEEPAKKLFKFVDAANVDLKSLSEDFYKKFCSARLKPILETLKLLHEMNVWIEITNLVIPSLNDDMAGIKKLCEWIKNNLGSNIPLHFSRFHPCYKMLDKNITPYETLEKAYETAKKTGLKYVYVGNVTENEYNHAYCPKCNRIIIERPSCFMAKENNLKNNSCPDCNTKIDGVWC